MEQCKEITASGNQCKREAVNGEFCKQHTPKPDDEPQVEVENNITVIETPGYIELPTDEPVSLGDIPQEKPKTPVTKPWSQEDNPWSQDLLALKVKRQGFTPRFVRNNPENINKFEGMGWQVAHKQHYGGVSDEKIGESGNMDTTVKRRGLILMELPNDLVQKRREYYDHKSNAAMKAANDIANQENERILRTTGENVLVENNFSNRRGNY